MLRLLFFFRLFIVSIKLYRSEKPLMFIHNKQINFKYIEGIPLVTSFRYFKLIRYITLLAGFKWTCYNIAVIKYFLSLKAGQPGDINFYIKQEKTSLKGHAEFKLRK